MVKYSCVSRRTVPSGWCRDLTVASGRSSFVTSMLLLLAFATPDVLQAVPVGLQPVRNATAALGGNVAPLCQPFTGEPVFIDCAIETGKGATVDENYSSGSDSGVHIVEYNIDRNGNGGDGDNEHGLQPFVDLLSGKTGAPVPVADVLSISEVARGCSKWGGQDVSGAKVLADALGMHWAYVVEYVDMDQSESGIECTIGNALLSKFPFQDLQQVRHADQCCRYDGRAGGRVAIIGNVAVSPGVSLRVASAHLESGTFKLPDIANAVAVRVKQAKELAIDLLNTTTLPSTERVVSILAGDLNAPLMEGDPTVLELEIAGFHDAHYSLPLSKRKTVTDGGGILNFLATDDYIFSPNSSLVTKPGVCGDAPLCNGWSDHVPIWVTVDVGDIKGVVEKPLSATRISAKARLAAKKARKD